MTNNRTIKIEARVPMPKNPALNHGGKWKDVLGRMKVGDSFALTNLAEVKSLRSSITRYKRLYKGQRYQVLKTASDKWRCWRTK